MTAWPEKSELGMASSWELVVCRKSYSIAPKLLCAISRSDNASKLFRINNLGLRSSITSSSGNRTVFGHVGARMSLNRFLAVALCAAAFAVPASAASIHDPNSLDEVIRRVQDQQKKTNSLEAEFRQEKTLALLASPEVSTGRFVYSKPNNVLWQYDA